MSNKRQATTELNHENWDQEDPSGGEEMGTFKIASKDILEKRVIKTAKRRTAGLTSDESKKSVFSGFGGFNKTQPSSFDFLSKLTKETKTNGEAETNGSSNKHTSTTGISPGGLFSSSMTFSTPNASNPPNSSLFSTSGNTPINSVFAMKSGPIETPFKMKTNHPTSTNDKNFLNSTSNNKSGSVFSSAATSNKLFSSGNTTETPTKAFNTFDIKNTNSAITKLSGESPKKESEPEISEYQLKYYNELKSLNESVSEWIKKHVEATPLCILTPIFKDYENHLKTIQNEFEKAKQAAKLTDDKNEQISASKTGSENAESLPFTNNKSLSFFNSNIKNNASSMEESGAKDNKASFSFGVKTSTNRPSSDEGSPGFSFKATTTTATSPFSVSTNSTPSTNTSKGESGAKDTKAGFSFGIKTSTNTPSSIEGSPGFSFKATTTTANPFSASTNSPPSTNTAAAPFSFGIGKPFSFSANVQKPSETTEETEKETEDEPPKVEYNPIVEENSVFEKKCKIFFKKEGNFADKGVGTLYIKKIEESGKYQLLVRANTTLGNVLLNFILSSGIPTQRMGKNNVMVVCIPTPEAKPPPTPILIRVKTSQEADELLETLNKYKA